MQKNNQKLGEFAEYIQHIVSKKRGKPADDLTNSLKEFSFLKRVKSVDQRYVGDEFRFGVAKRFCILCCYLGIQ
ncbi:hypothetical protein CN433_20285 [Bacillus cereus]|nr:hypothetical protein CON87_17375 [Bacillus cereus]PET04783.1 hypothetical protein CN516_28255 [Bacillus cereus]PEV85050.1 hypothetical protein CN433_20285 [Bacillus cereus]PFP43560.1 hypothetical protein COJ98_28260 [Bacillus cereus]